MSLQKKVNKNQLSFVFHKFSSQLLYVKMYSPVLVDEVDLQQLGHFNCDVEREWDDDLENDHERPERQETLESRVGVTEPEMGIKLLRVFCTVFSQKAKYMRNFKFT